MARVQEGLVAKGAITASEIPGAASTLGAGGRRAAVAEAVAAADGGGGRGDDPLYAALTTPELRDPRGFIIPSDQPDFGTATRFVNTLIKTGITIQRATAPFTVDGKNYPANSYVVKTAQAFRPHVMDMFEPQDHPDDIPYPGGPPTPPYDSTGYTLAFQMGVKFDRILDGLQRPVREADGIREGAGRQDHDAQQRRPATTSATRPTTASSSINRLLTAGEDVSWLQRTDGPRHVLRRGEADDARAARRRLPPISA